MKITIKDLLKNRHIAIIWGQQGYGKTLFLSYVLNEFCFDFERFCLLRDEIEKKNKNGFKLICPLHCCASNYDITFSKFGYSSLPTNRINPYRLGFFNADVKTHFLAPYTVIGITESQKYFNSRMSMYYPDWQSRFIEAIRHYNILMLLDLQRPDLADLNIRELALFIEMLGVEFKYNEFGFASKVIFHIRVCPNNRLLAMYMASDKIKLPEFKVLADYDVRLLYNSDALEPFFYAGHLNENFYECYRGIENTPKTKKEYENYINEVDDELPKNFYKKKVK